MMTRYQAKSFEPFRDEYVSKTIESAFRGSRVKLDVSQELFSSFEVDPGSAMLLKTISSEVDLSRVATMLDLGCGTGTLALTVRAACPGLRALCVDRDALALAFTAHNAHLNGLDGVECASSLGASSLEAGPFDLAVSNIPAKAGLPVIADMIAALAAKAGTDGRAAIVIVRTLADFAAETLRSLDAEILFEEKAREYSVFHYRTASPPTVRPGLDPYFRSKAEFSRKNVSWPLDAVYGLPEFDGLDHATELAIDTLASLAIASWPKNALIANPGQGHLAAYLSLISGRAIDLTLAGRDLLALEASARAAGGTVKHVPWLGAIEGAFPLVCVAHEKEAVRDAHELLLKDLSRLVEPGGTLLVTGQSVLMHRFDAIARQRFSAVKDTKRKGNRSVAYVRKTD